MAHQLQQPGEGGHHLANAQLTSVTQSPGASLGFSYAALTAATAALKASANVASAGTQENDQNSPFNKGDEEKLSRGARFVKRVT